MSDSNPPKTLAAQRARQGIMLGSVRWVLAVSLGLAVIAGIILYLIYFS